MIHARSRRADGPFIALNCATLAPSRFEEELFGLEGSPDGQGPQRRTGVLERAHGGTLLLDEVADMPVETQGKIVRALQDQTFERLINLGLAPEAAAGVLTTPRWAMATALEYLDREYQTIERYLTGPAEMTLPDLQRLNEELVTP